MRLRADASPDNLQWATELLRPEEFLAADAWEALALQKTNKTASDN